MHMECAIILLQLVTAHTRFIPPPGGFNATTVDKHSDHIVEETQHATCKISSKDLEATANASITRQLKGICTSAHLDTRMNILERTLVLEINNIKTILLQAHRTVTQDVTQRLPGNRNNNLRSFTIDRKADQSLQINNTETMAAGRDAEITKYNMTIHKDNSTGIRFIYYWRIQGEIKSTEVIESGDFYFSGNHLYIRVFPNYKHTEHTFIQVVGIEVFQLTHQVTVLDQNNVRYDIVSPLLRCDQFQCAGYQISHELLGARDIAVNDNMVIKLVIFLDI